ncbi:putative ankyrin repeat protein [Mycena indigotica]|uniref:Putative ankyrin repeat protein n=1 Tax=Mycena indigotica TaxID=2126181 RepID=A0A8H6W0Z3_9AGAR|nr:putative ankyrin repeat protein [Mycena indigotica]KAF7300977.1 putative ankyrin repeat protein [Mycena indigotica]
MGSLNSEANSFVNCVLDTLNNPTSTLDSVLRPFLDDEAELRRLFATDKANGRLQDPFVGLVDVFAAPDAIRTTRARVIVDDTDWNAKHVMPLATEARRKDGSACMVADLEEFQKNWSMFSEGSLFQLLDWSNVVAAGGSVLACLEPLPESAKETRRSMRKHYHSAAYPTSDVDLFLWGMTPEQAEAKILKIYEAVRDSVPWDVTCVRTKHTVSIHCQYPYRSVQIVLRLYSSPAEILAGFDIDAPCVLYNGSRVYASPRAIIAMMRQCNTVDMTRRSPSYEVRLAKYARRGFEVFVPSLSRSEVDPTIYERSIARITGLARLLVLEKLANAETRHAFLNARRTIRGRSEASNKYFRRKRKLKGDLKGEDTGLEMNDYDVSSLHIPYGPGWNARRIDRLVYQTDLAMNSTFNPKNKGRRLHRHPAFFGTAQECLDDCCEHCPAPIDEDERQLQATEDQTHIRGRISFIQEDPGRQSISGSFNPIDVGEWAAQAYIGPSEKFFAAIVLGDGATVANMIQDGQDINRRDHVGRMPLHVAIIARQFEVACDLVDAGARITSRLADGRTALHLAAQMDSLVVLQKLLERSAANKALTGSENNDEEVNDEVDAERQRLSSEDDWSSEEDPVVEEDGDDAEWENEREDDEEGEENEDEDEEPEEGDEDEENQDEESWEDVDSDDKNSETQPNANSGVPDDELDIPDVFEIDATDWDITYSPLGYAIVFARLPVVEALLDAGADASHVMQAKGSSDAVVPLALTLLRPDDEQTCRIAERLITAGASCTATETDGEGRTIFHRAVEKNKPNLVNAFLRNDPNGRIALEFPTVGWNGAVTPLTTAVSLRHHAVLAVLLAHGAKLMLTSEEAETAYTRNKQYDYVMDKKDISPIEVALQIYTARDVLPLLIQLGANISSGVWHALTHDNRAENRQTFLDWLRYAQEVVDHEISELTRKIDRYRLPTGDSVTHPGWKGHLQALREKHRLSMQDQEWFSERNRREDAIRCKLYLIEMEKLFLDNGAKTWAEAYPDVVSSAKFELPTSFSNPKCNYHRMVNPWNQEPVPSHLDERYDELFEACFVGDNNKIQELCLPHNTLTNDTKLQIAVAVNEDDGDNRPSDYTPFTAAVAGRRWQTVRLIVAIASAQHKPAKGEERFSTSHVHLDDDSDNESDTSNETVEQNTINFVDVAHRTSTVECEMSPQNLLEWRWGLLYRAIVDDDFEAFANVLQVYLHGPTPFNVPHFVLTSVISYDRPDMLDELIRQTGRGINVDTQVHNEGGANDQNRLYLGLNVHGKKRIDLAKQNDPNAHSDAENGDGVSTPMVWTAISDGRTKIREYLQGDKPLAAYKHYASTHHTERAKALQRVADLSKAIPKLLGWKISSLGESPLTAAICSCNLVVIEDLFSRHPQLMEESLLEEIKYLRVNLMLVAVQVGCPPAVLDFLLAKAVSSTERDAHRGWNVFHFLCNSNRHDLAGHLMGKLPRESVEQLLLQQSRGRLNTPLHVAVKHGHHGCVRLILDFSVASIRLRDVEGSLPLHSAVRLDDTEMVKLLLKAEPLTLLTENGVGETAVEMAMHQDLVSRNEDLYATPSVTKIDRLSYPHKFPGAFVRLGDELTRLKRAIGMLVEQGTLTLGTPTQKALALFVKHLEALEGDSVEPQRAGDSVLGILRAAGETSQANRELVHLVDVQMSVQNTLDKNQRRAGRRHDDDEEEESDEEDGEEGETPEEKELRSGSVFYGRLVTGEDDL